MAAAAAATVCEDAVRAISVQVVLLKRVRDTMSVHPLATGEQMLSDTALSDTAKRLSQVIKREVRRNSRTGWRQPSFPTFMRSSKRLQIGSDADAGRAGKRASIVEPLLDNDAFQAARGMQAKINDPRRESMVASIERQDSKVTELERQGSKGKCSKPSVVSATLYDRRSVTAASTSASTTAALPPLVPSTIQQRLWLLIDDPQSSVVANYLSMFVFFVVIVSTVVFIAQTEAVLAVYTDELNIVETACAGVFTLELLVRILTCPSKLRFFRDFANWIDIAAIFPFYIERMLEVDNAASFGAIRIVRLTRVARVLKMSRYSSAIQVFVQAIAVSMKALSMLIFLMGIAMIVFSSLIYFAEFTRDGCRSGGWIGDCSSASALPQLATTIAGAAAARAASSTDCICVDPNPYTSIAASFWWCIVTMSTVGYGDMTPVTLTGKLVGCASVLTGMLVLALPITVIGGNFQKVMKSVMQQTMKSNVEYLRGKRMLCRNEIDAILQRFHAVTEDIHLDVDDVINVYDEDNNGMLEDDELRRFRDDLEILQNRFMRSQQNGSSSSVSRGRDADDTAPLASSSSPPSDTANSTRQTIAREALSPLNTAARTLDGAAMSSQRLPYSPAFAPMRHASTSVAVVRYWNGTTHASDRHLRDNNNNRQSQSPVSAGPGSATIPAYQPSADSNVPVVHGTNTSSNATLEPPGVQPHRSDSSADTSIAHTPSTSTAATALSSLPAGVDSEVFWHRMLAMQMQMQQAYEEQLHETEARLEAKLQLLTKMLVRLESKLEDDND